MGRPRKEAAVAPKKRGRPKKVETVAPKKRGRPKKEEAPAKRKYTKRAVDTKTDTKTVTKVKLVEKATSKASSVAVTPEQLEKAKNLISSVRSQDVTAIKRAMQSVDRSEWNKWTHAQTNNGTLYKALTEAVAQELGI